MKDIISKAVEGGYGVLYDSIKPNGLDIDFFDTGNVLLERESIDSFIFSHEFLRAYFGEEKVYGGYLDPMLLCDKCGKIEVQATVDNAKPAWQYHAQQLVLSEDRVAYLRRYL